MYNVEILPSAWEDLKSIEDYYAIQFDVDTAIKVSGFHDTGSMVK